jgi:hypothetical protein
MLIRKGTEGIGCGRTRLTPKKMRLLSACYFSTRYRNVVHHIEAFQPS